MKIKIILCVLLMLILSFGLSCGGDDKDTNTDTTNNSEPSFSLPNYEFPDEEV